MIKPYILLSAFFISFLGTTQSLYRPSQSEINTLPNWAQLMYADNSNVFEVDQAYQLFYKEHLFEKNYHTQFYKRWRRAANDFILFDGSINWPSDADKLQLRQKLMSENNAFEKSGNWNLHGPLIAYDVSGQPIGEQSNVYSIDQSLSNPAIVYCGTETSEIYRSNDEGLNWFNVSLNDPFSGGVNAIAVHPTNPDVCLAGSGGALYRTTDGGLNWTVVLSNLNSSHEIVFVESSPLVVFVAAQTGLYRSSDNGITWAPILNERCWDVQVNTGNDNIIYAAKHNTSENLSEFYRSTDMGLTFIQQTTGWHTSTDAARNDAGVRIAVSEADPNRVYAYLIGESKTGDVGYIGLYRSNDSGLTWTLPNGPAGGPYSATHMNLAAGTATWNYHQGFYNCALMVSDTDPDKILLGSMNLYTSDDGGATFTSLAGYVGGPYSNSMHVDMQDFRNINGVTWITTDGGIYRSDDFFTTNAFDVRMNGIHSADYWGFGQGWNEDITIGGLYHNGNLTSYDAWGAGQFLQLGGGEPATGYVNPGENRRVYSSDINGRILPLNIGDPISNVGFGIDPNESNWTVESSELEFHPNNYSIAYTGSDNQLWFTENKGVSFFPFVTFGTSATDRITYIEIAWSNPDVMYVCQQMSSGNLGKLWKSTDGGVNWFELSLPISSNTRKMLVQVDPANENNVFIAFASGGNGNKVFKSTDGGNNWINLSTSILNNQIVHSISFAGGTDGGLYYATNQTIYYRNNSMSVWEDFGDGLPVLFDANIAKPFYRDGKIRIASNGKGIWESAMYEGISNPICNISVDKMETTQHCETDTFFYVDHSIINHAGATWEWHFQGGTPSTSTTWSENVIYPAPGTYLTTLIITDANGQSDTDSMFVTIDAYVPSTILNEGFETTFPPNGFEIVNVDNSISWELSTSAGAYGNSTQSMVLRGFDYWPGGAIDDATISVNMEFLVDSKLTFDVAYAEFSSGYSDTLEVLISTDCGATWAIEYLKSNSDLSTAPNYTSFFEPTANEWRTDTLDLSSYHGNTDVIIKFRSITGYGNNVYIDNINLIATDISNLDELSSQIAVFPNPVNREGFLNVITPTMDEISIDLYSASGKLVYRKKHQGIDKIDLHGIEAGVYLWVIRSSEFIHKGAVVIE